jgi:hypothetical protein
MPADPTSGDLIAHPRYETLLRTVEAQHDDLCRRYGAHHIGVGKKRIGGERQGTTCIIFYVEKKGDAHDAEPIPDSLPLLYADGSSERSVATDVVEIGGAPKALAGGIRGGHVVTASDGEDGTVGLVVRRNGADYMVTNSHVVTDPGRLPGFVTGHGANGPVVGTVERHDDLSAGVIRTDAALVRMPNGSIANGQFLGQTLVLKSSGDIAMNDGHVFYFVSKKFTYKARWESFVGVPTPFTLDGHAKHCADFHKLRVTLGDLQPGNSGAVVFREGSGGLIAVGLLFAGELNNGLAWVFPLPRILERLGLQI